VGKLAHCIQRPAGLVLAVLTNTGRAFQLLSMTSDALDRRQLRLTTAVTAIATLQVTSERGLQLAQPPMPR
jgi:hypothetical protein